MACAALVIILGPALWAVGLARLFATTLRFTLDKTTRELLFVPLPAELTLTAKSFVDFAGDRFIGRGLGSVLLLALIKGLGLGWVQLSFVSLAYCLLWLVVVRLMMREHENMLKHNSGTEIRA